MASAVNRSKASCTAMVSGSGGYKVNKKIILAKKNFKKFSFFNHYLNINRIIRL
jgi:hypothetical protein